MKLKYCPVSPARVMMGGFERHDRHDRHEPPLSLPDAALRDSVKA